MSSHAVRFASALALLAVAGSANAQQGLRVSISRPVTNNNSDNTGFNVGGSGIAGNTFGPQNYNAGNGDRTPIAGTAGAVSIESNTGLSGGTLSITGPGGSGFVSEGSLGLASLQLSSGVVTLATVGGGSVTVTVSPLIGLMLAQAISPQASSSVEATDVARRGVSLALEARGVNATSAVRVANALIEISRMQSAQAAPQQGTRGASLAPALHAAAATSLMSQAIEIFLLQQPNTPLPAPLLAAGLLVRAGAGSALPLAR